MPRVGGAHPASALFAVQREHINVQGRVEERRVERRAQRLRALVERNGALRATYTPSNRGGRTPGAEGVGLNLNERDRPFRQRAVRVEDRIVTVLPTLIGQPLVASTAVLDKAVAVAIAILLEPGER